MVRVTVLSPELDCQGCAGFQTGSNERASCARVNDLGLETLSFPKLISIMLHYTTLYYIIRYYSILYYSSLSVRTYLAETRGFQLLILMLKLYAAVFY